MGWIKVTGNNGNPHADQVLWERVQTSWMRSLRGVESALLRVMGEAYVESVSPTAMRLVVIRQTPGSMYCHHLPNTHNPSSKLQLTHVPRGEMDVYLCEFSSLATGLVSSPLLQVLRYAFRHADKEFHCQSYEQVIAWHTCPGNPTVIYNTEALDIYQ